MAKRASEFASAGRHAVRLAGAEGEPQEAEEVKEKPKTREIKWRQGDMEFEAYMRMLDNSVRLWPTWSQFLNNNISKMYSINQFCFLLEKRDTEVDIPTAFTLSEPNFQDKSTTSKFHRPSHLSVTWLKKTNSTKIGISCTYLFIATVECCRDWSVFLLFCNEWQSASKVVGWTPNFGQKSLDQLTKCLPKSGNSRTRNTGSQEDHQGSLILPAP